MRSLRGNNFGFKALNRLLEGGGGGRGTPQKFGWGVCRCDFPYPITVL